MAKRTDVILVAGEQSRSFEFSHAERLLRMRNNGGWHLPEGSKFEFRDNALYKRANTKASK